MNMYLDDRDISLEGMKHLDLSLPSHVSTMLSSIEDQNIIIDYVIENYIDDIIDRCFEIFRESIDPNDFINDMD